MDVAHSFSACSSSSQASLGMHPSVSSVLPDSLVLLEYVKQEPPSDTESTDRSLEAVAGGAGGHGDSLWEMPGTSAVQPEPSHALIRSEGTSGIQGGRAPGCEWSGRETELLLDLYATYFSQIGPLKKFRNKKTMFEKIASDLQEKLGVTRTGEQCCSRYKTVRKRKRPAKNGKPGDSSQLVPCEEASETVKWQNSLEIVSVAASMVSRKSCANSSGSELPERTDAASPVQEKAPDSEQEKFCAEKRKYRQSTARMRDMRFFFEKLEEIEERKAKRQAKRDAEREKRGAIKLQKREEMHREKMELLRKVFGLNDEQE